MGKSGRKKCGRNRGDFYRNGRGWYANDGKGRVPPLFWDGSRIKDHATPEKEIAAAYGRWKEAREAARKAAALKPKSGRATVEDVCRVYLAEARENDARETFVGRADTLFDLSYGLPTRFRAEDGTPKPMTEQRKKEAKAARAHSGYGRMYAKDFIRLHLTSGCVSTSHGRVRDAAESRRSRERSATRRRAG